MSNTSESAFENPPLTLIVTDWSEPHLDLSLLRMLFKTSLLRPGQPHMHEMVGSTTIGDGEIRIIYKSL